MNQSSCVAVTGAYGGRGEVASSMGKWHSRIACLSLHETMMGLRAVERTFDWL